MWNLKRLPAYKIEINREEDIMAKTWLITGCSEGGIGAAIARAALREGYNVAVTARNLNKISAIVNEYPKQAFPVVLDLNDKASIQEAVSKTVERLTCW